MYSRERVKKIIKGIVEGLQVDVFIGEHELGNDRVCLEMSSGDIITLEKIDAIRSVLKIHFNKIRVEISGHGGYDEDSYVIVEFYCE